MSKTNKVAGKPGLDPTLPDAKIVINGETYRLVFDLNAICLVERKLGVNLLRENLSGNMNAQTTRFLFWAGLLRERPEITRKQAGALLEFADLASILAVITAAWTGSIKGGSLGEPQEAPSR